MLHDSADQRLLAPAAAYERDNIAGSPRPVSPISIASTVTAVGDISAHTSTTSFATFKARDVPPNDDWRPRNKGSKHIFQWWPEILAAATSIISFIAMIIVLGRIDGTRLDRWRMFWKIQPSAVISVLITLCQMSLTPVIAEALSQLKWIYFEQRPQRLSDFDTFDEASRGPWGSMRLAYRLKWRASVASGGALLAVFALGMGPFTQQVLYTEVQHTQMINASAMINASPFYNSGSLAAVVGSAGAQADELNAPHNGSQNTTSTIGTSILSTSTSGSSAPSSSSPIPSTFSTATLDTSTTTPSTSISPTPDSSTPDISTPTASIPTSSTPTSPTFGSTAPSSTASSPVAPSSTANTSPSRYILSTSSSSIFTTSTLDTSAPSSSSFSISPSTELTPVTSPLSTSTPHTSTLSEFSTSSSVTSSSTLSSQTPSEFPISESSTRSPSILSTSISSSSTLGPSPLRTTVLSSSALSTSKLSSSTLSTFMLTSSTLSASTPSTSTSSTTIHSSSSDSTSTSRSSTIDTALSSASSSTATTDEFYDDDAPVEGYQAAPMYSNGVSAPSYPGANKVRRSEESNEDAHPGNTPCGDSWMVQAAYAGLFASGSDNTFSCPTGNCTYPTFTSLGICGQCDDLSDSVSRHCIGNANSGQNCTFTLAGYESTNGQDILLTANSTCGTRSRSGTAWQSRVVRASQIETPDILTFYSLRLPTAYGNQAECEVVHPIVRRCSMAWCAKTYSNSAVINGQLRPQSIQETPLIAFDSRKTSCPGLGSIATPDSADNVPWQRFVKQDQLCSNIGPGDLFLVNGNDHVKTRNMFTAMLSNQEYAPGNPNIIMAYSQMATLQAFVENNNGDLGKTIGNISTSMTNLVRSAMPAQRIQGISSTTAIVYKVGWWWLLYPMAIIILSITFFIATITLSGEKSRVIWKSSSLAVLSHGLDGFDASELESHKLKGMSKEAKDLRARLQMNEEGKLKLVRYGP